MRDVIRDRLRKLAEDGQELEEQAAALLGEFPRDQVAAALENYDLEAYGWGEAKAIRRLFQGPVRGK